MHAIFPSQGPLHLIICAIIECVRSGVSKHPFFFGVFLMVLTTSLWALAFAAPLAIPNASAMEIALGRFIVYGLISCFLIDVKRLSRLPRSTMQRAIVYALSGNILYYFLLVYGIQIADAALAVLIIGMLPVTVSIYGSVHEGKRTFIRLLGPIGLFSAGVLLVNGAKTQWFSDFSEFSALGTLCVVLSLAMWTWYAVDNAKFLKTTQAVNALEWSSLIGVVSLVLASILLMVSWLSGLARNPFTLTSGELFDIALWSIVLGAGATWFGTVLFNYASKLLKTAIVGQLIIFEAIFGMLYVFYFSGHSPGFIEISGIMISLLAVWLSIRTLRKV